MRRTDVQNEQSDNFEPAPLAITPDGGIAVRPEAKVMPPPPRICEAGPCVHYHRFKIQLDAEAPRGQDVEPGGKIVGRAERQPFYTEAHHYCYPTVGIELVLGSLPVLECNHWDPQPPLNKGLRREEFLKSPAGERYAAELATWREAMNGDPAEDPIQVWLTINMRDSDFVDLYDADGNPGFLDARKGPSWLAQWHPGNVNELTMATIRKKFGPGNYRLWISRHDDRGGRVRAATQKVEVI